MTRIWFELDSSTTMHLQIHEKKHIAAIPNAGLPSAGHDAADDVPLGRINLLAS